MSVSCWPGGAETEADAGKDRMLTQRGRGCRMSAAVSGQMEIAALYKARLI